MLSFIQRAIRKLKQNIFLLKEIKALFSRLALFLKNVALIQAMTAVSRQIEIDNNRNVDPHPKTSIRQGLRSIPPGFVT